MVMKCPPNSTAQGAKNSIANLMMSVRQVFKFEPVNARLANASWDPFIRERFSKRNSHVVSRNTGVLCLTVQRLLLRQRHSWPGKRHQVTSIKRVIYAERPVDGSSKLHDKLELSR